MGDEHMRNLQHPQSIPRQLPLRSFPTIEQQITAFQAHILRTWMPVFRRCGRRGSEDSYFKGFSQYEKELKLISGQNDVLHHQHIHTRSQITIDGFHGCVHNGLVFIERGIQQNGDTRLFEEFRNQSMVAR